MHLHVPDLLFGFAIVVIAITFSLDAQAVAPIFGVIIAFFSAYSAFKARIAERKSAEAKVVADATHTLVNSQRTELINANLELFQTVKELRLQIETFSGVKNIPKGTAEIAEEYADQQRLPSPVQPPAPVAPTSTTPPLPSPEATK